MCIRDRVDFDPQGNATIGCGIASVEETIVKAMMADINNSFTPSDLAIIHTDKFDVLPSNIELSNLELALVSVIGPVSYTHLFQIRLYQHYIHRHRTQI